ncbi:MAG: membrane protein insertion efficiency factor YidD [Bacteroidetes bacterium]|nr:membrane protein insertion efficiency factor YidD [Bacteroidota bacterium]
MHRFILFLLLLSASASYSQTENSINEKMLSVSFDHSEKPEKRKLLTFKKKSSYFNPLNYLGAGALFVYQNIFSEQIQASCTYEISCSQYTKISIQKFGFFKGVLKGFNQLSECAPTAIYEHPPVYVNGDQQIINHFEETGK